MKEANFDYTTVTTLVISVCILFGLLVMIRIRTSRITKKRASQGLIWLRFFRQLLTLTQQHRGLTNGYLCGDQDLLRRIKPLQANIRRLHEDLENNGKWLIENENWSGIVTHWNKLAAGFENVAATNNLEQHNKLINNILYLIDDCAEQHRLYEINDKQQRSIRYLWQELLVTAENIGQARAIGTGVAAAGECTSVDRIRLRYLHQAIDNVTEHYKSENDGAVEQLLSLLQKKIILDTPSVGAHDYFEAATLALEEVLKKFDEILIEQQSLLSMQR